MKKGLSQTTRTNLFKFRKIKTKILVLSLTIFIISQCIVLGVSSISSYKNTMMTLESALSETAAVASSKLTAQLNGEMNLMHQIASSPEISSDLPKDTVLFNLAQILSRSDNYNNIYRSDAEGNLYGYDINITDREYFQVCKETEKPFVSDPLESKDTKDKVFFIASPIIKNGVFDGVVVASTDHMILSKYVQEIVVGEGGTAYILNKDGTTIAAYDEEIVKNEENIVELAKTDDSLADLAAMEAKMAAGETGFKETYYDGNKELNAYTPIEGTNGWSLAVTVQKSEFVNATYLTLIISIVISFIILIIATFLLRRMANNISKPIVAINAEMLEFGKGNLSTEFVLDKDTTEIGQLVESIHSSKRNLKEVISDTINCCQEMAQGNFSTLPAVKYIGEFEAIETAIRQINYSLSHTLGEINIAAEQVSYGAVQVSSGAQSLAQGATEQAATSQELSSSIATVSEQVVENASNASEVNTRLSDLGKEILSSNEKMQHLIAAMTDISTSSNEIEKIIKTIEDIAFQTNILALNAAVEAARAGAAGKGFAVVADEVRNLASKSAEAAKNTTDLIGSSIQAVKNGTMIADETAKSLFAVVTESSDVREKVETIAIASNEQANSLVQITDGMEQISAVVQANSATSEESAATAEELSAQSQILKNLVSRFKLLNQDNNDLKQESNSFNNASEEDFNFADYSTEDTGSNSKY